MNCVELIDRLGERGTLEHNEWVELVSAYTESDRAYAAKKARAITDEKFGKKIFIRGIVEFSNICRNDCLYCGIRRSNSACSRYRLTSEEIISCCDEGYGYGFRTFVLQSGEDGYFTADKTAEIVSEIKKRHPDCAVTLSLGELEYDDYKKLFDAGADRYLLRHETADEKHYAMLHPPEMSWRHRMDCLKNLKEIGFQTGCGFMVGSPFQTSEHIARDMEFIGAFKPEMIGIGPFIPHRETPFADKPAGSYELTLFLLSLCRIMLPSVLLPATTALGTLRPRGREEGVLAGANVVMPNLSPLAVRKKYQLYDNKICTGDESAQCIKCMGERMRSIGCEIAVCRGDFEQK